MMYNIGSKKNEVATYISSLNNNLQSDFIFKSEANIAARL